MLFKLAAGKMEKFKWMPSRYEIVVGSSYLVFFEKCCTSLRQLSKDVVPNDLAACLDYGSYIDKTQNQQRTCLFRCSRRLPFLFAPFFPSNA